MERIFTKRSQLGLVMRAPYMQLNQGLENHVPGESGQLRWSFHPELPPSPINQPPTTVYFPQPWLLLV
jgi:hypothetical protein